MSAEKGLASCLAAFMLSMSVSANADWLSDGDPAEAASLAELEEARGRQDLQFSIDDIQMVVQQNDGEQSAYLENNLIEGALTGNNWIAADAMSGLHGIATVIQNTGNQVIIQDTIMVNIMMRP